MYIERCQMTHRQLFWSFILEEWRNGSFDLTDLWFAYERMRGNSIAGAHFVGKVFGDC